MKILKSLAVKPWQKYPGDETYNVQDVDGSRRVAVRFLLAVISVFFSLLAVTFLARSQLPDFLALAAKPWQPLSDLSHLWFNTAILASSGAALHIGLLLYRRANKFAGLLFNSMALILALMFILAQLWLWRTFYVQGFSFSANPANSYFFLFTGLHAVHLIVGIGFASWWLIAQSNHLSKEVPCQAVCELSALDDSLSLCVTYWHYLFIVWLLIFSLMVSSPSTYQLLAGMCGF